MFFNKQCKDLNKNEQKPMAIIRNRFNASLHRHSVSNLNHLNRFFRRDYIRLFYPTTINSHSRYWPIRVNSTGGILTLWPIRLRGTSHTRVNSCASTFAAGLVKSIQSGAIPLQHLQINLDPPVYYFHL